MCVLCRDTFSRSDILKRHFQKCSIRRGNPTGASHLSHPQAHVKKNAQAAQKAAVAGEGEMNQLNGMNNMPANGMVHPFGMVPVQDVNNSNGDRRNMPPVMGGSQHYESEVPPMNAQPMQPYGVQPYMGSSGGQQSNLDWSQMFHGTHEHQLAF